MKTAIILHGTCDEHEYFEMDFPSPSNAHWLPWLQQKFLRSGMLCQTLEMPKPYAPVYEDWSATFEQIRLEDDTIIIGHSSGCGFILKWLGQHPNIKLAKLVFVAPYRDPFKMRGEFLQCQLDPMIAERVGTIDVLYSTDDSGKGIKESVDEILQTYSKAKLYPFTDKRHFCFKHIGPTFPELWTICQVD